MREMRSEAEYSWRRVTYLIYTHSLSSLTCSKITGLAVHMTQVHKEQLPKVENAIDGRESVDIEIFGMEGIPENEIAAHRQRVLSQISQAEAERRAQAGIPGTGKKSKVNAAALDPDEIKRRLEEHKRAVVDGSVTPSLTPGAPGGGSSPGRSQSPGQYGAAASPVASSQGAYVGVRFSISISCGHS